jgi:sulfite reductase alpha subunit-like flavoprotein
MAMDAYQVRSLADEKLAIFVVATTGEGEAPDNMKTSWRFLKRKDLPRDSLSEMEFAVFGMGDSSYEKFNAIARMLNARLQQLGGSEIVTRGLGDDQSENGYMTDLDPWLQTLWSCLLRKNPIPAGYKVDDAPQLWEPAYDFAWVNGNQEVEEIGANSAISASTESIFSPASDASSSTSNNTDVEPNIESVMGLAASGCAHPFYLAPEGAYSPQSANGGAAGPHVTLARVIKNERMTATDWDQVRFAYV